MPISDNRAFLVSDYVHLVSMPALLSGGTNIGVRTSLLAQRTKATKEGRAWYNQLGIASKDLDSKKRAKLGMELC
jgi:hypothetical protein